VYPGKSGCLALFRDISGGCAIGWPVCSVLGNLHDGLTMPVECSLSILGFKVSVAGRGLLVLVVQYGTYQMQ
jgi:hypothetical protein